MHLDTHTHHDQFQADPLVLRGLPPALQPGVALQHAVVHLHQHADGRGVRAPGLHERYSV
jgi:hypothetical protein